MKTNNTNNYLTPAQVKELNFDEMFIRDFDEENHMLNVYPVFETYKCFDLSYTSRKMATLAKEYIKAFFANRKVFDNKPFWNWTDAMEKIQNATMELVEALSTSVINSGDFAKAVKIVQQFLHRNPVMVAKGQLKAIYNFNCDVPHKGVLRTLIDAYRNLIEVCEKYPEDAYKFFD